MVVRRPPPARESRGLIPLVRGEAVLFIRFRVVAHGSLAAPHHFSNRKGKEHSRRAQNWDEHKIDYVWVRHNDFLAETNMKYFKSIAANPTLPPPPPNPAITENPTARQPAPHVRWLR